MRFRSVSSGADAATIQDSVVVSDEYHMNKIGLERFKSQCLFVETKEAATKHLHSKNRITILDASIERIIDSFEYLAQMWGENDDLTLTLVTKSELFWSIFQALSRLQRMNHAAVTEIALNEKTGVVSFSISRPEDDDLKTFLAGLQYQNELPDLQNAIVKPDQSDYQELEEKLLNVLQALPLVGPRGATVKKQDEEAPQGIAILKKQLKETKGQLEKLRKSNTELNQRYQAIANSKFGRLTLKYWTWRKAKVRGRNF